mmetsp:Transcript_79037/g.191135  ORF Transcript_79037/g.191135 Transcript_79037/m.191135 type:complete len:258 (+) Transcript_79037:1127-1900(+)
MQPRGRGVRKVPRRLLGLNARSAVTEVGAPLMMSLVAWSTSAWVSFCETLMRRVSKSARACMASGVKPPAAQLSAIERPASLAAAAVPFLGAPGFFCEARKTVSSDAPSASAATSALLPCLRRSCCTPKAMSLRVLASSCRQRARSTVKAVIAGSPGSRASATFLNVAPCTAALRPSSSFAKTCTAAASTLGAARASCASLRCDSRLSAKSMASSWYMVKAPHGPAPTSGSEHSRKDSARSLASASSARPRRLYSVV